MLSKKRQSETGAPHGRLPPVRSPRHPHVDQHSPRPLASNRVAPEPHSPVSRTSSPTPQSHSIHMPMQPSPRDSSPWTQENRPNSVPTDPSTSSGSGNHIMRAPSNRKQSGSFHQQPLAAVDKPVPPSQPPPSSSASDLPSFVETVCKRIENPFIQRPMFLSYFDTSEFQHFTYGNFREDHVQACTRFLVPEEGTVEDFGSFITLLRLLAIYHPTRPAYVLAFLHFIMFAIAYSLASWENAATRTLLGGTSPADEQAGVWYFLLYIPFYFFHVRNFKRGAVDSQVSTDNILSGYLESGFQSGKPQGIQLSWNVLSRIVRPVWLRVLGNRGTLGCLALATILNGIATAVQIWRLASCGCASASDFAFSIVIRLTCYWFLGLLVAVCCYLLVLPILILAFRVRFLLRDFKVRDNYFHLQYSFDDVTFEFHTINLLMDIVSTDSSLPMSSAVLILWLFAMVSLYQYFAGISTNPLTLFNVAALMGIVMLVLSGAAYGTYHMSRLVKILSAERGQLGPRPYVIPPQKTRAGRHNLYKRAAAPQVTTVHRKSSRDSAGTDTTSSAVEKSIEKSEDGVQGDAAITISNEEVTSKMRKAKYTDRLSVATKKQFDHVSHFFSQRVHFHQRQSSRTAIDHIAAQNSQYWAEYEDMDIDEFTRRNAQLRADFDSFAMYVNVAHPGAKISGIVITPGIVKAAMYGFASLVGVVHTLAVQHLI